MILRQPANLVGFNPDGRRLVAGDLDSGHLQVLNLEAEEPASAGRAVRVSQKALRGILLSPDGRWLVTRDADKRARLWSLGSFGVKK